MSFRSDMDKLAEDAYAFFKKAPGDPLTPEEAQKIKQFIWDRKKQLDATRSNRGKKLKAMPDAVAAVIEAVAHPTESYIEERLLLAMNTRSLLIGRIRTQLKVGPYRLDMAFPDVKLCVEADGKDYHSAPDDIARDQARTKYLASLGWTVIRFTGSKINGDLYSCVDRVTTVYEQMCREAGIEEPWETPERRDD